MRRTLTAATGHAISARLLRRDYVGKVSLLRAAPQVRRRFPEAVLEVMHSKLEGGFFWIQQGKRETL